MALNEQLGPSHTAPQMTAFSQAGMWLNFTSEALGPLLRVKLLCINHSLILSLRLQSEFLEA